ncbi:MAG TPA: response regulator transcription factor [Polyangiaceae bacterium]|nr:response regulator transcription factor [Polyangiaceae bacterium]
MLLLLVEDNALLASLVASSFGREGWQVTVAQDGLDALRYFEAEAFDVVVIDWLLPPPGPCGLELCEHIRKQSPTVGLLFATAKETLGDRLLAFKAGADDYLVKPFDSQELLARVSAVARRSARGIPLSRPVPKPEVAICGERSGTDETCLRCESILVDMATLRVTVAHDEVELSLRQLLILIYLMRRQGQLVPESELREQVLRSSSLTQTSTLRNHIHQLRQRLGAAGALLYSVHGRGYGIGVQEAQLLETADNECAQSHKRLIIRDHWRAEATQDKDVVNAVDHLSAAR